VGSVADEHGTAQDVETLREALRWIGGFAAPLPGSTKHYRDGTAALAALAAREQTLRRLATAILAEVEADLPRRCLFCALPDGEHVDGCVVPDLRAALAADAQEDTRG